MLSLMSCAGGAPVEGGDASVVLEYDLDAPESAGLFAFSDPAAWRWSDGSLELFGKSGYQPAVRSPRCIALLNNVEVEDFVLEARLKQTGRDYGHRDMCIFFGYEGPSRYYYVHLASKADDHAHNIFLVDNAARRKIATRTTAGIDWGRDVWHRVLIERRASDGHIAVYFDGEAEPIMVARDQTMGWGRVGFGSFDDTGMIDDIRVQAPHIRPAGRPAFPVP